ncbi:SSI family serine proteinase inhibitor [Streptomyces triculaminicus]|uniref:SSI family serine proteinase inhibitor n=1 Tax=Streptomyces triculaminicus TaxID=2816232 RepID=UPI0037D24E58
MSLRSLALAAALTPALLAVPAASAAPLPLGGAEALETGGDHLTITVSGSGGHDRTYELYCHPAGGTHPHPQQACDQLDTQTKWGKDLFAPVPEDANCTQIYGGDEQAHVRGTWAGRPVNADFNKRNGCEMARWDRFSTVFAQSKGSPKKTSAESGRS